MAAWNRYYCIVAGLPDLSMDDTKVKKSSIEWMTEWWQNLDSRDKQLITIPLLENDNHKILSILYKRNQSLSIQGVLSENKITDLLTANLEEKPTDVPDYLFSFVNKFYKLEEKPTYQQAEKSLWTAFLSFINTLNNPFLSGYYSYLTCLRNILTAINSRLYLWDNKKLFVGEDAIIEALLNSRLQDFGLQREFEDIDVLLQITESVNLIQQEKKLDSLKWYKLEELSRFNYFSIEVGLAYLIKNLLLERWIYLGKQDYHDTLSDGVANIVEDII